MKLSKKSQARQRAIREALARGKSVGRLLACALALAATGYAPEGHTRGPIGPTATLASSAQPDTSAPAYIVLRAPAMKDNGKRTTASSLPENQFVAVRGFQLPTTIYHA